LLNQAEMACTTPPLVLATVAHEPARALDDLHGVPMATSMNGCYQTEIHAYGTMIY
jgi:hypothetical protein